MKDTELSRQIFGLIQSPVRTGNLRPRTLESIQEAIVQGRSFYVEADGAILASVIVDETTEFLKIGTLVCHPDHQGKGYASQAVAQAVMKYRAASKPLVAVAAPASKKLFLKLGFTERPKDSVPAELWGGRTLMEWQACDRSFMVYAP